MQGFYREEFFQSFFRVPSTRQGKQCTQDSIDGSSEAVCVVCVTFQVGSAQHIITINSSARNCRVKKQYWAYRYIDDSDLAKRGKATAINTSSKHATKCSSSLVSISK